MKDVNILNLMNIFPKWVWYGGLSPHECTWRYLSKIDVHVIATDWVLELIYDMIWYILFSILSWPMISTQYPCFVLTLTCMFLSLLFVECSKRAVVFNSIVILASLRHTGSSGWANASSLDWIFFFMSWCLEVPA